MKNIAVVGCGYWGQNLVRSAHDIGILCAVSDTDPARTKSFAEKYAVKGLSWEETLKDKDVAGVMLAVPAPFHAQMAIRALQNGKHVFVEKPIALSIADAKRMVDEAEKAKRQLMVGHLLQYHPAFIALKGLDLGELRHVHSSRLNFGKVRTEENVFWSFAPHDISMILALADRDALSVTASYTSDLRGSDLPSTAIATFDFGKGLTGHVHVSWLNPFKEQKLVVVGTKGMAVFDDTLPWDKKLAHYKNTVTFENGQPVLNKTEPEYVAIAQSEPLKDECRHFAECVDNNAVPRTDGNEGLRVLRLMQACDYAAEKK